MSYLLDITRVTVPAVIIKLRSILVIPIVMRTLGLGLYGAWVQLTIATNLFSLLGGLGLHTALVRYYPECRTDSDKKALVFTVVGTSSIFSFLICIVLWLFSPVLARLILGDASQIGTFRFSLWLIPLNSLNQLLLQLFRAKNDIRRYAAFRNRATVVDLFVTVAAALVFRSVAGLVFGAVLSLLITNAALIYVHMRRFREVSLPHISLNLIRKHLRYSLPVLPSQFSDEIAARGDRLVVGVFLGPAAVGAYSVIYAMASLAIFFQTPVVEVLFPKLAHLRATNQHSVAAIYMRRTLLGLGLVGLCSLSIIVLLRDWLWPILAGPNVSVFTSGSLALFLFVAGLGVILYALSRILSLNLFTGDQTHIVPLVFGLTAIVNVAANLVLIPHLELLGAVISTLLAYLTMALVTLWFIRKKDLI